MIKLRDVLIGVVIATACFVIAQFRLQPIVVAPVPAAPAPSMVKTPEISRNEIPKVSELVTFKKETEFQIVQVDGAVTFEVTHPTSLALRFTNDIKKIEVSLRGKGDSLVPLLEVQKKANGAVRFDYDPFNDPSKSGHSSISYKDVDMELSPSDLAEWTETPKNFVLTDKKGKTSIIRLSPGLQQNIFDAQAKNQLTRKS